MRFRKNPLTTLVVGAMLLLGGGNALAQGTPVNVLTDCSDVTIDGQTGQMCKADDGQLFFSPDSAGTPTDPVVVDDGQQGGTDCAGEPALAIHNEFLRQLRPYWDVSWEEYLTQAGFQTGNIKQERNPQEDPPLPDGNQYISGLQVKGTNLPVMWPNVLTTNDPNRVTQTPTTRYFVAAQNTGSTIWTNVILNGEATIYASGYSWGQMSQYFQCVALNLGGGNNSQPISEQDTTAQLPTARSDNGGGDNCLSNGDLKALGQISQWLVDEGVSAGAQLTLNQDYAALPGWTMQRNARNVSSANEGQMVSLWAPHSCYPLKGATN